MKRYLNIKWASVILVAIILIALTSARVMEATAAVDPPLDVDQIRERDGVPVEVVLVEAAPLRLERTFTGTVRGIRSATLRANTGDQILEIPVRVGQSVAEGAVLVRQSSEGSMSSADQAQAAHDQALRTVNRLRPLYEQGAISEQAWDEAQTGLRVAGSNLETARKAIVLTSPISGTVTNILVTEGSYPGPGDPMVRVSDLSRAQILIQVSPDQRRELALRQAARMADGGQAGEITRIALHADPESRLVEVEMTFPGSASFLPGALTSVNVVVLEREEAISVPAEAVDNGLAWLVDQAGMARHVAVETGARTRDRIEILSGLTPGDQLVVAGATLLTEGALTRIVGG